MNNNITIETLKSQIFRQLNSSWDTCVDSWEVWDLWNATDAVDEALKKIQELEGEEFEEIKDFGGKKVPIGKETIVECGGEETEDSRRPMFDIGKPCKKCGSMWDICWCPLFKIENTEEPEYKEWAEWLWWYQKGSSKKNTTLPEKWEAKDEEPTTTYEWSYDWYEKQTTKKWAVVEIKQAWPKTFDMDIVGRHEPYETEEEAEENRQEWEYIIQLF